jgi:hypothetical protein
LLNPRSTSPSVRFALVSANRPFSAQQDRNFQSSSQRSTSGNTSESFAQQESNHQRQQSRSRMCRTGTMTDTVWCLLVGMNLTATAETKLWGIYHTDREYARIIGDPLRTTVEAPTKEAAEKIAAGLGFSAAWAHPVAPEVARMTETILKRQPAHRQECGHKTSRGIRI